MAATLTFFAEQALLPDGWQRDVQLTVGQGGCFAAVTPQSGSDGAIRLAGPVLPGLCNLHSHAFQRAMAALTERSSAEDDNFWTWREVMYRFLAALGPEDVEAVAAWLYIELLLAAYTSVVKFHYLHHAPDGSRYAAGAELSLRILAASQTAGIGLTMLAVLYSYGSFGGAAPSSGPRRFLHSFDSYAMRVEDLAARLKASPHCRLGVAPHSLRTVTPEQLQKVIGLAERLGPDALIHLHVAEQQAEVAACQAALGAPPVAWLLDNVPVDRRFCLVHATHMTASECERLGRSGAVAGLCPSTEANFGNGLFDAPRYLAAGGRFGVGSDSNVGTDPFEELRLLEYGQRLALRRRNVLASGPGRSVGGELFAGACIEGAQAAGQPMSRIAVGCRADLVVLDGEDPSLCGREGEALLDAAVFGPRRGLERDVVVAGRFVVRDRVRPAAGPARAAYAATLRQAL